MLEDTVRIMRTMVGLWLKPCVYNQMYRPEPKMSMVDIPSQPMSYLVQKRRSCLLGVSSFISTQSLAHPVSVLFLYMCENTLVCTSSVQATLVHFLSRAHKGARENLQGYWGHLRPPTLRDFRELSVFVDGNVVPKLVILK